MNRARSKGTHAESKVVEVLQAAGFAGAERRALHGALDKGDIVGVPSTAIEVKNHDRITLSAFVTEANVAAVNSGARYGVAWIKKRGKADPRAWYVAMSGDMFLRLLADALGLDEEAPEAIR